MALDRTVRRVLRRRAGTRGATLLEVMVALGILATSYVALLETQSGSVRLSTYGKEITIATFLAQNLIEETEEKLQKDGFPETDSSDEGKFDDEGYPSFRWKLEVRRVELPIGNMFDSLLANWGKGGEEGDGKESGAAKLEEMVGKIGGADKLPGQVGQLLQGGMGGMGGAGGLGGAGGGMSQLLNPDMLRSNAEMLADTIEQAIREVNLTVSWEEGGPGYELKVTTHLVQVPQASGESGAMPASGVDPFKQAQGIQQLQPNLPGRLNSGLSKNPFFPGDVKGASK